MKKRSKPKKRKRKTPNTQIKNEINQKAAELMAQRLLLAALAQLSEQFGISDLEAREEFMLGIKEKFLAFMEVDHGD